MHEYVIQGVKLKYDKLCLRTSCASAQLNTTVVPVLEIVAKFRQIGEKNEIDPPAGDKKWILGVPCQIARGWRQKNKLLRAKSPIGDRKRY